MYKKHIVTWDMLQIYTKKLASKIYSIKKWKGIIGVSRGGLIPATLLARELSIRYVDTLCICSYNDYYLQNIKVLKKPEYSTDDILIVDDLVDTGGTAKIIRKMYPSTYFVTIFAKPKEKRLVDNYMIDIPQNIWVEQPWDMTLSYSKPLIKEPKIK
ncbi:xanthine phosphoribosyltransferase [Buchnera aphidicola]|uniref:xanthine phosphoribosyltransferase n=1 Tax=Buchnera aphidicola TaxID=9 RepID=UPI003464D091